MTDDPMKLADDFFATLDRFDAPEGWNIGASAGWAWPGVDNPEIDVPTIPWNGRTFPSRFTLIAWRDNEDDRETPIDLRTFTRLFMSIDHERVVHLNGTFAQEADIDELLPQLLRIRPLSWFKTKAVLTIAVTDAAKQTKPEGWTDEDNARWTSAIYEATRVSQARRNNRVTRSLLEEVARVYRKAIEEGRPPTVAVERELQTSRANASKWVARARQERILGPAVGPTGGEGPIDLDVGPVDLRSSDE